MLIVSAIAPPSPHASRRASTVFRDPLRRHRALKTACIRVVPCFIRPLTPPARGLRGPQIQGPIGFTSPSKALVAIALCCGGDFLHADVGPFDFSEALVAESRTVSRDDGIVTLDWPAPSDGFVVELQQSAEADFSAPFLRYRGPDAGSSVTGLPDGTHQFRIRLVAEDGAAGPWSPPYSATITYMDRGRVIWLLLGGGVIVLATVGAILAGHFRGDPEHL